MLLNSYKERKRKKGKHKQALSYIILNANEKEMEKLIKTAYRGYYININLLSRTTIKTNKQTNKQIIIIIRYQ